MICVRKFYISAVFLLRNWISNSVKHHQFQTVFRLYIVVLKNSANFTFLTAQYTFLKVCRVISTSMGVHSQIVQKCTEYFRTSKFFLLHPHSDINNLHCNAKILQSWGEYLVSLLLVMLRAWNFQASGWPGLTFMGFGLGRVGLFNLGLRAFFRLFKIY